MYIERERERESAILSVLIDRFLPQMYVSKK